jgi:tetratricopeptide (TPR) repeat protein
LERYLMDTCKSLKDKIKTNEQTNKNSFSTNTDANEWYLKGIAEYDKGNTSKAVEYYRMALKIDSNFAFAWDNLGLSYRQKEDYDSAIYAYKKSLQIDPRGLTPLQNMAVAYLYKKNYEKAISTYEHMAKLDPNNPEIYYGIGNVYASYLQNYEEGLRNMCKAYNLYIQQKSPYRTDAEKVINQIYTQMKEKGKEKKFKSILKENNINMN